MLPTYRVWDKDWYEGPYRDGVKAHREGLAVHACPYPGGTWSSASFAAGWVDADLGRAAADEADRANARMNGMWRCQGCGEAVVTDGRWRWTGDRWQHHHDYPVGHVDAISAPTWSLHAMRAYVKLVARGCGKRYGLSGRSFTERWRDWTVT